METRQMETIEYREAVRRVQAHTARQAQMGAPLYAMVATFGCQQNEADSERIMGMLSEMGYCLTEDRALADLILINTCAVREHAELKVLSVIGECKHLREKKPHLMVGVTGCMTAQPHRVAQLKKSYPYVDFTLDPSHLHLLPQSVANRLTAGKRTFCYLTDMHVIPEIHEEMPVVRKQSHRAWVSIMYGCNNFCSYCIVPYVRGRERSRESSAILAEVRGLIAEGCKEITLLGQNVNSYRSDCDFAELLERICALEGDFLVRFMTSHPKDVPDRLIEVMGREKKLAPHFHLPVQSGSDRILREMNRHYDRQRYLETVQKLRAAVPAIALTSDMIVGFPSETEEDFEATLSLMREVRFDMVYSFIYSKRKGTPAAVLEDLTSNAEKSARMSRLLALQDEIAAECNAPYLHRRVRVLVDSMSRQNEAVCSARTDTNKLVHFIGGEGLIGTYQTVYIDRVEPYALYGTMTDA